MKSKKIQRMKRNERGKETGCIFCGIVVHFMGVLTGILETAGSCAVLLCIVCQGSVVGSVLPVLSDYIGKMEADPGNLAGEEWLAVILAAFGVGYLIVRSGTVPVLAVLVGGSFAIYGMMKKGLSIRSDESLFLETLLVSPAALVYMIVKEIQGTGAGGVLKGQEWLLLPLAGIITAVPLLIYSAGVKMIPFYLAGILMYLNPTIQFLMGIFLYKEKIDADKFVSFAFIWAGILVMLIYSIRMNKRKGKSRGQG